MNKHLERFKRGLMNDHVRWFCTLVLMVIALAIMATIIIILPWWGKTCFFLLLCVAVIYIVGVIDEENDKMAKRNAEFEASLEEDDLPW